MQITTNGSSWSNAAASQQVTQGQASSAKPNNRSSSTTAEIQLEQSEKAGDRDAQERYEGPLGRNTDNSDKSNEPKGSVEQDSLLQLPAMEEEPSQLDLRM